MTWMQERNCFFVFLRPVVNIVRIWNNISRLSGCTQSSQPSSPFHSPPARPIQNTVHAYAESNYVSSELLLLEIESDFTRTHFKDLTSWRLNAQILHISILWEKGLHYFARIHRKAKEGSERSAFNAFMLISSLWRGLERFACNA